MGHCLPSDHQMTFRLLPLVKPLATRAEADSKWRRLPRRPCELVGAMFDVALAFPLPMADCGALDTAAVRGLVAHRRQAANRARLQHHRLGPNRPNALDRQELLVSG
jgi:hypothetical protein